MIYDLKSHLKHDIIKNNKKIILYGSFIFFIIVFLSLTLGDIMIEEQEDELTLHEMSSNHFETLQEGNYQIVNKVRIGEENYTKNITIVNNEDQIIESTKKYNNNDIIIETSIENNEGTTRIYDDDQLLNSYSFGRSSNNQHKFGSFLNLEKYIPEVVDHSDSIERKEFLLQDKNYVYYNNLQNLTNREYLGDISSKVKYDQDRRIIEKFELEVDMIDENDLSNSKKIEITSEIKSLD